MSIVGGIDPGRKGYLAVLSESTGLKLYKLPYVEDTVNVVALHEILKSCQVDLLAIEIPSARPGVNSINTTIASWKNWGKIVGACEVMQLPILTVAVQTWQAKVVHPFCKPGLEDSKARSISAAQKLFPGEAFLASPRSRTICSDMTDSALIALWAKLTKS